MESLPGVDILQHRHWRQGFCRHRPPYPPLSRPSTRRLTKLDVPRGAPSRRADIQSACILSSIGAVMQPAARLVRCKSCTDCVVPEEVTFDTPTRTLETKDTPSVTAQADALHTEPAIGIVLPQECP